MGTETHGKCFHNQILTLRNVKLNNPLMGTETSDQVKFQATKDLLELN